MCAATPHKRIHIISADFLHVKFLVYLRLGLSTWTQYTLPLLWSAGYLTGFLFCFVQFQESNKIRLIKSLVDHNIWFMLCIGLIGHKMCRPSSIPWWVLLISNEPMWQVYLWLFSGNGILLCKVDLPPQAAAELCTNYGKQQRTGSIILAYRLQNGRRSWSSSQTGWGWKLNKWMNKSREI